MDIEDARKMGKGAEIIFKIALSTTGPVGPLIEGLFYFRQNLKTARAQEFLIEFIKYVEKISGKNIDDLDLNTEDFSDLFEKIFVKALQTKSKVKLERFKRILANEAINPSNNEYAKDKYILLVEELNEAELLILLKLSDKGSLNESILFSSIGKSKVAPNADFRKDTWRIFEISTEELKIEVSASEMDFYINI